MNQANKMMMTTAVMVIMTLQRWFTSNMNKRIRM